jgi:glycolate oxidase iron-sulfur subunit
VRFAARVRDVTELLADAGPKPGAPLPLRVAYDAPCHLVHAQRVADAPLVVLGAIPALVIAPHAESDACCGSAGLYSLVQRALARDILDRKLDALAAVAPDMVVTGNPGCAMHLSAGLRATGRATPVAHPVELLDASYAKAGGTRRMP